MKRWMRGVAAGIMAAALVACGGGGGGTSLFGTSSGDTSGTGTGTGTGSTTPQAATVEILSSATSVGSNGDTATLTAVVKDTNNVGMSGATVVFSADSGILTQAAATTDSTGTVKATFQAGANKANRSVTVRAASGSVSGNVVIQVTGSKLSISGATSVTQGVPTTLTVKVQDSAGSAVSNTAVAASSSLGNGVASVGASTDSQGQMSFTYTPTIVGADNVTFTALGASAKTAITVSASSSTSLAFSSPTTNEQIPVGQVKTVSVSYVVGGVPQVGQTLLFAASGGTLSAASAVTDSSGVAQVTITSATAMSVTLQVSTLSASVLATVPVQFVATTPASLVLQVSPTSIGPNAGTSTTNQSQLTATVRDAQSNPVSGVTVNFTRLADPSQGSLGQLSATTDLNGLASVQYIAGPNSTANGAVQLRASVATNAAVYGDSSLTVSQSALFIALGTGNTISNADEQTYQKNWTAYVTDVNGAAVTGAQLTVTLLPRAYAKGRLTYNGTAWVYASSVVTCANEDANYNGRLDSGEDFNTSTVLEPGNVISVTSSQLTTDSTGRATIVLRYAESYVPWVQVALKVSALVSGTESSTQNIFWVEGASADFADEAVPPAGVTSPFGTSACNIAG